MSTEHQQKSCMMDFIHYFSVFQFRIHLKYYYIQRLQGVIGKSKVSMWPSILQQKYHTEKYFSIKVTKTQNYKERKKTLIDVRHSFILYLRTKIDLCKKKKNSWHFQTFKLREARDFSNFFFFFFFLTKESSRILKQPWKGGFF